MASPEHVLQKQINNLLSLYKIMHFAVPNGGLRNLKVAKKLKDEGVLAGVSDLIIVLQGRVVFVELKTKTGVQSVSQKVFQKNVEALGHTYLIWRSFEDCLDFIKKIQKGIDFF